jgi:hypothetical protein
MFTAEILVAVILIPGPESDPAPLADQHLGWVTIARPSLLAVSVNAEILDARGVALMLRDDIPSDLASLRKQFCTLGASPWLGERLRFPDKKFVSEMLGINRKMREALVAQLAMDLVYADTLRLAIQETDQLYQVWYAVRDAQNEYYYTGVRRQALQLVRDLIGDEAFYSGRLPPPIPVWHIPRR